MPEIIRGEPTVETVGQPRRRTLFDMIENPEPGWVTRKLHRVSHIDRPAEWTVEIMRESDGLSVSFESESLFVAWARATEAAHMQEIGLYQEEKAHG